MAGAAAEKCDALVVLVGETFKPGKDPLSRLAADALKARRPRTQARQTAAGLPQRGHCRAARRAGRLGRWLGQAGADRRAGGRRQLAHLGSQAPGDLPARRRRRRRRARRRGRDGRGQLCLRGNEIQARRPRTATRDHRRGRRRAATRPGFGAAKAAANGIEFARELAQPAAQPGHAHAAGRRSEETRQDAWLPVRSAGPQGNRQDRHGFVPGGGPGLGAAACASSCCSYQGAAARRAAAGAGRQGHHLRLAAASRSSPRRTWTR